MAIIGSCDDADKDTGENVVDSILGVSFKDALQEDSRYAGLSSDAKKELEALCSKDEYTHMAVSDKRKAAVKAITAALVKYQPVKPTTAPKTDPDHSKHALPPGLVKRARDLDVKIDRAVDCRVTAAPPPTKTKAVSSPVPVVPSRTLAPTPVLTSMASRPKVSVKDQERKLAQAMSIITGVPNNHNTPESMFAKRHATVTAESPQPSKKQKVDATPPTLPPSAPPPAPMPIFNGTNGNPTSPVPLPLPPRPSAPVPIPILPPNSGFLPVVDGKAVNGDVAHAVKALMTDYEKMNQQRFDKHMDRLSRWFHSSIQDLKQDYADLKSTIRGIRERTEHLTNKAVRDAESDIRSRTDHHFHLVNTKLEEHTESISAQLKRTEEALRLLYAKMNMKMERLTSTPSSLPEPTPVPFKVLPGTWHAAKLAGVPTTTDFKTAEMIYEDAKKAKCRHIAVDFDAVFAYTEDRDEQWSTVEETFVNKKRAPVVCHSCSGWLVALQSKLVEEGRTLFFFSSRAFRDGSASQNLFDYYCTVGFHAYYERSGATYQSVLVSCGYRRGNTLFNIPLIDGKTKEPHAFLNNWIDVGHVPTHEMFPKQPVPDADKPFACVHSAKARAEAMKDEETLYKAIVTRIRDRARFEEGGVAAFVVDEDDNILSAKRVVKDTTIVDDVFFLLTERSQLANFPDKDEPGETAAMPSAMEGKFMTIDHELKSAGFPCIHNTTDNLSTPAAMNEDDDNWDAHNKTLPTYLRPSGPASPEWTPNQN